MPDKKPDDMIGHNSDLSPEERRDLFFRHFNKISAQADRIAVLQAEMKTLRKTAKADGIVLADVDFAMRCATLEDDSIIVDELRRRTEIAAWMALPVEFQADMFGGDLTPADDRAFAKGKLAKSLGKKGDPTMDGYDASTPQWNAWLNGFNDGDAPADAKARKGARKGGKKNGAPSEAPPPDADAVAARTAEELGESIPEVDKSYSERLAEANQRGDAMARGEAPPAFN
jgi:hypothetical protein